MEQNFWGFNANSSKMIKAPDFLTCMFPGAIQT